jgi:hypothetical protein
VRFSISCIAVATAIFLTSCTIKKDTQLSLNPVNAEPRQGDEAYDALFVSGRQVDEDGSLTVDDGVMTAVLHCYRVQAPVVQPEVVSVATSLRTGFNNLIYRFPSAQVTGLQSEGCPTPRSGRMAVVASSIDYDDGKTRINFGQMTPGGKFLGTLTLVTHGPS